MHNYLIKTYSKIQNVTNLFIELIDNSYFKLMTSWKILLKFTDRHCRNYDQLFFTFERS